MFFTAAFVGALAWTAVKAADPFAKFDDHRTAGLIEMVGRVYTNNNYGYAVSLPAGQTAWVDKPPSPNHGLRIFLGPRRSIEVDASHDAALLGSTDAVAEDAADWGGGAKLEKSADRLGGKSAERVSVIGPAERRRLVVARWASENTEGDAINYAISLETLAGDAEQDTKVFDGVIKSFRFVPRSP